MVSKAKRKAKRNAAKRNSGPTVEHVNRSMEKGDYKQALKEAKVGFRKSPDLYRLPLEFAFVGRAQQAARNGDRQAARGVIEDLLTLGVREPSVEAALPELLVSLGMQDRLQQFSKVPDEQLAMLALRAADESVLRPDEAPKSQPHLALDARRIREALDALYAGDESAASVCLRGIASDSPFADWRFFVRGLAAYYRQDTQSMLSNWQRLDDARFAVRIAGALKIVAGVERPDQARASARGGWDVLNRELADGSLPKQLDRLHAAVVAEDWPAALQMWRDLRGGLRKLDRALYQRLVRCLSEPLIRKGLLAPLNRLTQLADPPPLDPDWNRAKAMACEWDESSLTIDALPYWKKYLNDLGRVRGLASTDIELARGLVWHRIGTTYAESADKWRCCTCGNSHDAEVAVEFAEAQEALENCLALVPTYVPAYEALAELYDDGDEPEKSADTYRRLLNQVPDNTDALETLVQHYLAQDEPLEAQLYTQRLLKLKPLDAEAKSLGHAAHRATARWYARRCEFEQGRAEFAAGDALWPARRGDFDVLGCRAVLEIKAEDAAAARQLVTRAQESLDEPAPLWLLMMIEATRYELPAQETCLYENRWTMALRNKCQSSTAGVMCRLMRGYLETDEVYACRADHVTQLVAYVRRCSRVRWRQEDLREVCEFLDERDETKLLDKYVRKGQRTFPDAGYYHALSGRLEIDRGPRRCRRKKAIKSLRRAVELLVAAADPRDEEVLQDAKRSLTFIEELAQRSRFPHFFADPDSQDDRSTAASGDFSTSDQLPAELYQRLIEMCKAQGVDPDVVIREFAAQANIPIRDDKGK